MQTNHAERLALKNEVQEFVQFGNRNINILFQKMNSLTNTPLAYGLAEMRDFEELTPIFERLFAYDDKHFYVYKAISNPSKIGYLSHKQYMKFRVVLNRAAKTNPSGFAKERESFLELNGTMASPYKLLKKAFKDNKQNCKFLSYYFPFLDDGKVKNEDRLIEFCDSLMQNKTLIEIKDAPVQDCYNLDFRDSDIRGSGERYCTNSCMQGKKVGSFYEAFGVHGKMVYYRGRPVGRFLYWDLPDGKHYVDRLYIHGDCVNEALAGIDKQFDSENNIKYPSLRNDVEPVLIELKNSKELTKKPKTPYIDTFPYLFKERGTNKYFLSNNNRYVPVEKYEYQGYCRSTNSRDKLSACKYCNEIFFSHGSDAASLHNLYCEAYKPRNKEQKAYLDIFRKNIKVLEEKDEQTFVY